MVILKRVKDIVEYLHMRRSAGSAVGFVPTMGALHSGHLSLVQRSKEDGGICVCSVFVNPTQFNDKNDLAKYPRSVDEDIALLTMAGCDVLFLPEVEDIYPGGEAETPSWDFGYLETILEGASRPGHFRGVGQVVARLLQIVTPDRIYLGSKDYQQCMVIRKLAALTGMTELKVIICPTKREEDGLAMSSRNRRLTASQRVVAGVIYQCLISIQSKQDVASFAIVQKECEDLMKSKGFVTEYVALAKADDLTLLDEYQPGTPMVALIATRIGEIRLIDNLQIA